MFLEPGGVVAHVTLEQGVTGPLHLLLPLLFHQTALMTSGSGEHEVEVLL